MFGGGLLARLLASAPGLVAQADESCVGRTVTQGHRSHHQAARLSGGALPRTNGSARTSAAPPRHGLGRRLVTATTRPPTRSSSAGMRAFILAISLVGSNGRRRSRAPGVARLNASVCSAGRRARRLVRWEQRDQSTSISGQLLAPPHFCLHWRGCRDSLASAWRQLRRTSSNGVVELRGIEPLTSSLRTTRSTN